MVARECTSQKFLGSRNGTVCPTSGDTRVGVSNKAWNIIGFDEFFDNPLVNDAVVKGERENMPRLWVVNGEFIVG